MTHIPDQKFLRFELCSRVYYLVFYVVNYKFQFEATNESPVVFITDQIS